MVQKAQIDELNSEEELVAIGVLLLKRLSASQGELAREMHKVGFKTSRIALLLGTTPNTINQAIQAGKRKSKTKAAKGR
jgi:predicted transcriptional regulator